MRAATAPRGDGAAGETGLSCTAVDNGDGTVTISCEDGTTVTVSDGAPGADGEDGAAGAGGEDGEDGAPGADGEDGAPGADGESCTVVDNGDGTMTITCGDTEVVVSDGEDGEGLDEETLAHLEAMAAVGAESCTVCHAASGSYHQAVYDGYADESELTLTVDSVASVDGTEAGTFDTTLTFTLLKNGAPYVDADGMGTLGQKRFMGIQMGRRDVQSTRSPSPPPP